MTDYSVINACPRFAGFDKGDSRFQGIFLLRSRCEGHVFDPDSRPSSSVDLRCLASSSDVSFDGGIEDDREVTRSALEGTAIVCETPGAPGGADEGDQLFHRAITAIMADSMPTSQDSVSKSEFLPMPPLE